MVIFKFLLKTKAISRKPSSRKWGTQTGLKGLLTFHQSKQSPTDRSQLGTARVSHPAFLSLERSASLSAGDGVSEKDRGHSRVC